MDRAVHRLDDGILGRPGKVSLIALKSSLQTFDLSTRHRCTQIAVMVRSWFDEQVILLDENLDRWLDKPDIS